jgi:hypothetical protein
MIRPLVVLGVVALAVASFAAGSFARLAERAAASPSASADPEELARRLRSIDGELRSARREREARGASDLAERPHAEAAARAIVEGPSAPRDGADSAQHEPGGERVPDPPSDEQLALEAEAQALLADAIRAGAWRDPGQFRARLHQLTRDQQVALVEQYSAALNAGKLAHRPGEAPF